MQTENGSESPFDDLESEETGEFDDTGVESEDTDLDMAGEPSPSLDPVALARLVAQKLDDDKAENILEIDLAGKSPMADAMIVASGRSQRHVAALADHVSRALKDAGVRKVRVEGLPNADWVLIDAGDIIVHIFRPEVREFYNLERIWSSDAAPTSRPAEIKTGI